MPPWRELGGHVRCPCAAASRTRAKRSTRTRTSERIPHCGGEEGSGKSRRRTAPKRTKRNQKVRDVFAGRALTSHSSRRIEEGHDVLNTCVSRSSSRSWRCYARLRPSWRRLRALPRRRRPLPLPPPHRVGPRRTSYVYAFSYRQTAHRRRPRQSQLTACGALTHAAHAPSRVARARKRARAPKRRRRATEAAAREPIRRRRIARRKRAHPPLAPASLAPPATSRSPPSSR